MSEKSTVRVTILGEEYAIRSDMDSEYTLSCAKHVDDAVQEAHVKGKVAEPHRAAVLAALQITDELFRERQSLAAQSGSVLQRLQSLREQVDEVVG